jgi:hypothetical protein
VLTRYRPLKPISGTKRRSFLDPSGDPTSITRVGRTVSAFGQCS